MSQFKPRGAAPARPPAARTAWAEADWYLGMVGAHGHAYHRHLALPALLEALDAPRGASLLDLGCGPGVLAPHAVRRGLRYTGLDASPAMIAQARRLHGGLHSGLHGAAGQFVLGDARRLPRALGARPFDAVTFLLSLQDMEPLDAVLREAARALRPGGVLIAVLTHPCFRVPRHSGWGHDPARKLYYRRVERYLTPFSVPSGPRGKTTSFHRPLETYIGALYAAGFATELLRELAPTPALTRELGARGQPGNADLPALLLLRARKGG